MCLHIGRVPGADDVPPVSLAVVPEPLHQQMDLIDRFRRHGTGQERHW